MLNFWGKLVPKFIFVNQGLCGNFELCAERKGKKGKHRGLYASLFGVGAPEALVIGVVALLVFGPKGLAEVGFSCFF